MKSKEHVTQRRLSVCDNLGSVDAYFEMVPLLVVNYGNHVGCIEKKTFQDGEVGLFGSDVSLDGLAGGEGNEK